VTIAFEQGVVPLAVSARILPFREIFNDQITSSRNSAIAEFHFQVRPFDTEVFTRFSVIA